MCRTTSNSKRGGYSSLSMCSYIWRSMRNSADSGSVAAWCDIDHRIIEIEWAWKNGKTLQHSPRKGKKRPGARRRGSKGSNHSGRPDQGYSTESTQWSKDSIPFASSSMDRKRGSNDMGGNRVDSPRKRKKRIESGCDN